MDPDRLKHLEMIQAVITRLGNDSFLVKGWSITVAGAFFGFSLTTREPWLAATSILPTAMFWWLDTYYLHAERLFRCLFDRVRKNDDRVEPFFMGATTDEFLRVATCAGEHVSSRREVARRPTLAVLYLALLIAAAAITLIAASLPDPKSPWA